MQVNASLLPLNLIAPANPNNDDAIRAIRGTNTALRNAEASSALRSEVRADNSPQTAQFGVANGQVEQQNNPQTANTSRRQQGRLEQIEQPQNTSTAIGSLAAPSSAQRPRSLEEIQRPQAELSSASFADIFGSEEFAAQSAISQAAVNRGRLLSLGFAEPQQTIEVPSPQVNQSSDEAIFFDQDANGDLNIIESADEIRADVATILPFERPGASANAGALAIGSVNNIVQDVGEVVTAQSQAALQYARNGFLPDSFASVLDRAA